MGANGAPFLNPFGAQTDVGAAYIAASQIAGRMQDVKGTLQGLSASLSGELTTLPAGPLGFAIGAEVRKETIDFRNNFSLIREADSSGLQLAEDVSGRVRSGALYAELNMPVVKDLPLVKRLELPLSLRYDHYDTFGGTTNPKAGVRWQVSDTVLLRGSYSRGFRAPGVYELYRPNVVEQTGRFVFNDPLLCPGGVPVPGADPVRDCGGEFNVLRGGNPTVQPETSRSWMSGLVFDITRNASISVDYFDYRINGLFLELGIGPMFDDPVTFASKFVRCSQLPPERAAVFGCAPGAVDPLAYVDSRVDNYGTFISQGWDLAVNLRSDTTPFGRFSFSLNGTYWTRLAWQVVDNGEYTELVGRYALGLPSPRWQHVIQLGWEREPWSARVVNRYKRGYTDDNTGTIDDAVYGHNKVGNWSVVDASVTYGGRKGLTLTVGVQNVFDKEPPFSNQGGTFQVGYEPRLTDPVGRALFVQASYRY